MSAMSGTEASSRSGAQVLDAKTRKKFLEPYPPPDPGDVARPVQAPPVLISHAGEQRRNLVAHIRERLLEHRLLSEDVFVDECTLNRAEEAMSRISTACHGAKVAVVILSKHYVRKWACMAELHILLQRIRAMYGSSDDGSQQHSAASLGTAVMLLPVLYGMTVHELSDMRTLYETEPWCVESERPPDGVLELWAADLKAVTDLVLIRPDQYKDDAELTIKVVDLVMKQLGPEQRVMHDYSTPPPRIEFVGRNMALQKGLRALLDQRYVQIQGAPGEGKSTLAQHLVQALQEELSRRPGGCPAYIFEVDMQELFSSDMEPRRALAAALLRQAGSTTNGVDEWRELRHWLRQPADIVIVLENAEKGFLSQSHGHLTFLQLINELHRLENVSLLVPTRVEVPVADGLNRDVVVVELDPLTTEQGLQLVQAHLGPSYIWVPAEQRAAELLVRLVDGNPLVLSVAAGLVRNSRRSRWQDILRSARAPQGLSAVGEKQPDGMGTHMLFLRKWVCEFLDIDERSFLVSLTVFSGSFTTAGAAAVTGCAEAQEHLYTLLDALLVREGAGGLQRPEGHGPRYWMHALVKDAAVGMSDAAGGQQERRPLQAFFDWMLLREEGPGRQLLKSMPDGLHPDLPLHLYLLNVELLNFAALGAELAGVVGQNAGRLKELLPGMLRVGRALSKNGAGDAARQIHASAVDASEHLLGPEHPACLTSKHNLAGTLRDMGELAAARRLHEEVLEVRTRVLGPEHPDTVTSKSNLAVTLGDMGALAEARGLEEEVLEVRTRVLGPEHPDTLISKGNLAGTLHAMGDWAAARWLQEEVLDVCKRVLGPEHPDTLTSQNNLAVTLLDMGERAAALRLQEEELEVRMRVLGPEHPATLTSKNNLAVTLRDMGERAAARRLQEEELEVRMRVLGPEHPDTLTSKSNLAQTLGDMGEQAAARRLQEEVLKVLAQVLGSEHPDTLTIMSNLAVTLGDMGERAAAQRLHEQVLEVRMRVLGPVHPDTLTSKSNLALTLRAMGERAVAQRPHEALKVRTRVLEAEHVESLNIKNDLALTPRDMGEQAAAWQLHKEEVEVRKRLPDNTVRRVEVTEARGLHLKTWARRVLVAVGLVTLIVLGVCEVSGRIEAVRCGDQAIRLDMQLSQLAYDIERLQQKDARQLLCPVRWPLVEHARFVAPMCNYTDSIAGLAGLADSTRDGIRTGPQEKELAGAHRALRAALALLPGVQGAIMDMANASLTNIWRTLGCPPAVGPAGAADGAANTTVSVGFSLGGDGDPPGADAGGGGVHAGDGGGDASARDGNGGSGASAGDCNGGDGASAGDGSGGGRTSAGDCNGGSGVSAGGGNGGGASVGDGNGDGGASAADGNGGGGAPVGDGNGGGGAAAGDGSSLDGGGDGGAGTCNAFDACDPAGVRDPDHEAGEGADAGSRGNAGRARDQWQLYFIKDHLFDAKHLRRGFPLRSWKATEPNSTDSGRLKLPRFMPFDEAWERRTEDLDDSYASTWAAALHGGDAVVFVHGYNVDFKHAIKTAWLFHSSFCDELPTCPDVLVYSWGSWAGHFNSIWYYFSDRLAMREIYSVRMREHLVRHVLDAVTSGVRLLLLAHSMGNEGVTAALGDHAAAAAGVERRAAVRTGAAAPGLRHSNFTVVFAAPDVGRGEFQKRLGKMPNASLYAMYCSPLDGALQLSSALHATWIRRSKERVGLCIPHPVEPSSTQTFHTVDVSHVPPGINDKHFHSLFYQWPVVRDIRALWASQLDARQKWLRRATCRVATVVTLVFDIICDATAVLQCKVHQRYFKSCTLAA